MDGDPFIDAAGAQANLEMEWDVVATADPKRTDEAMATAGAAPSAPSAKPEAVQLREELNKGAKAVEKTVKKLTTLKSSHGVDVFGSYEAIEAVREQLQHARDELARHGPTKTHILDDEDDAEDVVDE